MRTPPAKHRAVEAGCAGPPGRPRPTDPLPDELRGRVQLLAAGYDQLALEVSTHMAPVQRYRRTPRATGTSGITLVDQRV